MLALWNTPHIPPGSICVRLAAAKPLAKTGLWQNHDNVFTTMEKDSKIYVAEHLELVGSALIRKLESEGYSNLITRSHSELDLTRQSEVEAFIESERPEYVILAAAKVGGIWANNTYPAEFIYSNLAIQTNVIHASWRAGVKRLLFLGSSCFYPRDCPQPMKEEYLLTGSLESTSETYAIAKIAASKCVNPTTGSMGPNSFPSCLQTCTALTIILTLKPAMCCRL